MSLLNDLYGPAAPVPAAPAPVPPAPVPVVRAAVPVPPAPENSEPVTRIVFTNQMLPDVYVMLRQYEHHSGAELREIFDAALREDLIPKPEAHQPLPPARAAKLQERLLKKESIKKCGAVVVSKFTTAIGGCPVGIRSTPLPHTF